MRQGMVGSIWERRNLGVRMELDRSDYGGFFRRTDETEQKGLNSAS